MNEKIVLIIEKLFLAVMGIFFIRIGLYLIFLEESSGPHISEHPLIGGILIKWGIMAPAVLVLVGLFSSRWMAVVAHAVVIMMTLLFLFMSYYGPFWGDWFRFIVLLMAFLLFGLALRRAMKEH